MDFWSSIAERCPGLRMSAWCSSFGELDVQREQLALGKIGGDRLRDEPAASRQEPGRLDSAEHREVREHPRAARIRAEHLDLVMAVAAIASDRRLVLGRDALGIVVQRLQCAAIARPVGATTAARAADREDEPQNVDGVTLSQLVHRSQHRTVRRPSARRPERRCSQLSLVRALVSRRSEAPHVLPPQVRSRRRRRMMSKFVAITAPGAACSRTAAAGLTTRAAPARGVHLSSSIERARVHVLGEPGGVVEAAGASCRRSSSNLVSPNVRGCHSDIAVYVMRCNS